LGVVGCQDGSLKRQELEKQRPPQNVFPERHGRDIVVSRAAMRANMPLATVLRLAEA